MKYLSDYMEDRQTACLARFGVFFAFSDKQFNEKKVEGTVYVSLGSGSICPKSNVKEYMAEMEKIYTESIAQDLCENGKKGVIHRELGNHEFCITCDITDTMDALANYGITEDEVRAEIKPYMEDYYKWEAEQEKAV